MATTGINSTSSVDPTITNRGTKIQKGDTQLDQNAFLKILTTELSNQDPDNTQDSSAYVAQLAQFSSLEQMSNINTNTVLSSANSMIGKGVVLSDTDPTGNPYQGIVKSVSKSGSNVVLNVDVGTNGTSNIQQFAYGDVVGVTNNPNETTSISSNELSLMSEASMIGKNAEFNSKDANGNNYTGLVQGVVIDNGVLNLNVKLDNSSETKEFTVDQLLSLSSAN